MTLRTRPERAAISRVRRYARGERYCGPCNGSGTKGERPCRHCGGSGKLADAIRRDRTVRGLRFFIGG